MTSPTRSIGSLSALRQTGRTHRMLREALATAISERAYVFVIACNERDAERLRLELSRMDTGKIAGTKFYPENGGEISVESAGCENVQWTPRLGMRGARPECRVLADHYAIETRFGHLFEMMHRYDPPPTGDPR